MSHPYYKLTVSVDFHIKTIDIQTSEEIKRYKLQLWNIAEKGRFSSVRTMYYRGALGILLIFDLTNNESFEHLPNWIEEIRYCLKKEIPILLSKKRSANSFLLANKKLCFFNGKKFGLDILNSIFPLFKIYGILVYLLDFFNLINE